MTRGSPLFSLKVQRFSVESRIGRTSRESKPRVTEWPPPQPTSEAATRQWMSNARPPLLAWASPRVTGGSLEQTGPGARPRRQEGRENRKNGWGARLTDGVVEHTTAAQVSHRGPLSSGKAHRTPTREDRPMKITPL